VSPLEPAVDKAKNLRLPLVPFETLTLRTRVQPAELARVLFDKERGPWRWSRAVPGHKAEEFKARIVDSGFKMRWTCMSVHGGSSGRHDRAFENFYLPIAVGCIRGDAPAGSTVHVTLRPTWWSICAAIGLLALLLVETKNDPWVPLAVLLALHCGVYLFQWLPERARVVSFLEAALE
jgi:hypothetical protein